MLLGETSASLVELAKVYVARLFCKLCLLLSASLKSPRLKSGAVAAVKLDEHSECCNNEECRNCYYICHW